MSPQSGRIREEMRDPTVRFSGRVGHYARWRPDYPAALTGCLTEQGALKPLDVVADIGSGTGLLTAMLLRHGNRVYGVEPNREMREAAERELAGLAGFTSVDGRAEATGLPDGSVDVVAAAQAFHWFDTQRCRAEFRRILRPGGSLVLVWNDRDTRSTPLMGAYESLLRTFGTDYHAVRRRGADEKEVEAFFGPGGCRRTVLPHRQDLDLEGLQGRLLSSSYVPAPGETGHDAMIREMESIFREHAEGGRVRFVYNTRVYHGPLD